MRGEANKIDIFTKALLASFVDTVDVVKLGPDRVWIEGAKKWNCLS